MNVSHLKAVLKRLMALEAAHAVQLKLGALSAAQAELAGGTNNQKETAAKNTLNEAIKTIKDAFSNLTPQQKRDIAELNAEEYFSDIMAEELQSWTKQIQTSPGVGRSGLQHQIARRKEFIDGMIITLRSLDRFGIDDDELKPGESELEIRIPRNIFKDGVREFSEELEQLDRLIRTYYELNNLSVERVELKHLSASEPTITIAAAFVVVTSVVVTLKFMLDFLNAAMVARKNLMELRKTQTLDEDFLKQAEARLETRTSGMVDEAVAKAMESYKGDANRKHELSAQTTLLFGYLENRLEQGMIVIPRSLPPPGEASNEQADEFALIVASLNFPQLENDPTRRLTKEPPAAS